MVLQFAAAAATAQSTEAALQAALAAERVACQEARHALQAVTASHASAEARLRELDVSARADSGAGARLAAGAAVMSAVQQEVAVLKSVVGSERQEHRRLVGALRGALARAEEQAGREKEALGRELEAAREAGERERAEREGFMKELEEAREAGERGRAAVREGEQVTTAFLFGQNASRKYNDQAAKLLNIVSSCACGYLRI